MSESVRALQRGLEVMRSLRHGRDLTMADVARATDLSRATARRLLQTLEELGYVTRHDGRYSLTPRVLDLGHAYISSLGLVDTAMPFLEQLTEEMNESVSIGVLDGAEVVYIARVPAKRIMTVSIGIGTRFPAYQASLGRALLADLSDDEIAEIWEQSDRSRTTEHTVTSLDELLQRIKEVRATGVAIVDQEVEIGLRSIAMPLHDASSRVIASVNVSTHTSRSTMEDLQQRFAPALQRTVQDINRAIGYRRF